MVSDSLPLMHISHTETHMINQMGQTCTKAYAIYTGNTSSFPFLFNPPSPPNSASPSRPFSLSAHPSGCDVLPAATTARSLFGQRAADRHARCPCVSVAPSVPPFCNVSLSGVSDASHAASHCPLLSVICLRLPTSDYLCFVFFPPVDSGGAVIKKKKKEKGEINKPLPLSPSPWLPLHLLPPCCYSHNNYTFPYVSLQPETWVEGNIKKDFIQLLKKN